jgi:hypothetical protein
VHDQPKYNNVMAYLPCPLLAYIVMVCNNIIPDHAVARRNLYQRFVTFDRIVKGHVDCWLEDSDDDVIDAWMQGKLGNPTPDQCEDFGNRLLAAVQADEQRLLALQEAKRVARLRNAKAFPSLETVIAQSSSAKQDVGDGVRDDDVRGDGAHSSGRLSKQITGVTSVYIGGDTCSDVDSVKSSTTKLEDIEIEDVYDVLAPRFGCLCYLKNRMMCKACINGVCESCKVCNTSHELITGDSFPLLLSCASTGPVAMSTSPPRQVHRVRDEPPTTQPSTAAASARSSMASSTLSPERRAPQVELVNDGGNPAANLIPLKQPAVKVQ